MNEATLLDDALADQQPCLVGDCSSVDTQGSDSAAGLQAVCNLHAADAAVTFSVHPAPSSAAKTPPAAAAATTNMGSEGPDVTPCSPPTPASKLPVIDPIAACHQEPAAAGTMEQSAAAAAALQPSDRRPSGIPTATPSPTLSQPQPASDGLGSSLPKLSTPHAAQPCPSSMMPCSVGIITPPAPTMQTGVVAAAGAAAPPPAEAPPAAAQQLSVEAPGEVSTSSSSPSRTDAPTTASDMHAAQAAASAGTLDQTMGSKARPDGAQPGGNPAAYTPSATTADIPAVHTSSTVMAAGPGPGPEAASPCPADHPSCSTPAADGAPAAGPDISIHPQVVKVAGKTLVFYGQPACSICGGLGHAAHNCSAAFCFKCNTFGHTPAR